MPTDHYDLSGDAYIPDPERDATAVVDGFFAHLEAALDARGIDNLIPEMRTRLPESTAAEAHRNVDAAAAANLRITLALVVAYRLLRPRLGRDESIALLRAAFVEPLGEAVRTGTRFMLDAAPDPFAAMVAVSKSRETHAFGAGFTFERPVDDDSGYHVDIVRYFYHEVLEANSAAELTPIMCDFDANWIGAIEPDSHGFRFDRATTIGRGGSHCPFHFDRTR
ncbi:L-2-amino-thiazoline-4-carboxylic acid hydrolase [Nocardia crassostreae]|uniref:L-2-amino-thiazoline-4-carboxylic acid hydrolase n=1 Tax=Nocardia crassostreae TaxID=53428 RepID=UPI000833528C|nr:L-2-amino-thiazoline-4-carboxylic acid hydrolase [Nocardia crassostreae]